MAAPCTSREDRLCAFTVSTWSCPQLTSVTSLTTKQKTHSLSRKQIFLPSEKYNCTPELASLFYGNKTSLTALLNQRTHFIYMRKTAPKPNFCLSIITSGLGQEVNTNFTKINQIFHLYTLVAAEDPMLSHPTCCVLLSLESSSMSPLFCISHYQTGLHHSLAVRFPATQDSTFWERTS